MAKITAKSTLEDVAAIVSSFLERAGIAATLSGGAAVSIYSNNEYQSKDLDFVTAALIADLSPVLTELGFVHTGVPRMSQFSSRQTMKLIGENCRCGSRMRESLTRSSIDFVLRLEGKKRNRVGLSTNTEAKLCADLRS